MWSSMSALLIDPLRGWRELSYGSEHLLWICIAQTTFIRPGYGCAESGEEDDVIGVFLEDGFQSSLRSHPHGAR